MLKCRYPVKIFVYNNNNNNSTLQCINIKSTKYGTESNKHFIDLKGQECKILLFGKAFDKQALAVSGLPQLIKSVGLRIERFAKSKQNRINLS